jgi:hypothetical protein
VKIAGGKMVISFPESKTGQAVISAIAVASLDRSIRPVVPKPLVKDLAGNDTKYLSWLDLGDKPFGNKDIQFYSLPPNLYGANWIQINKRPVDDSLRFSVRKEADIFIGIKRESKILIQRSLRMRRRAMYMKYSGNALHRVVRSHYLLISKTSWPWFRSARCSLPLI